MTQVIAYELHTVHNLSPKEIPIEILLLRKILLSHKNKRKACHQLTDKRNWMCVQEGMGWEAQQPNNHLGMT